MLSLASAASAFSLAPHRAALPYLGAPLLRGTAVRMADGEKPMKSANESPLSAVTDKLSTVPWNDLLLGFVTVDCAGRLSNSVPALFGPSPNYLGTALDVLFVGYGALNLAKKAGILKGKDYYEELEGGDVRSFAFEAGEFALAGEVPFRTKDGRYEVATFAGGCFWGTELHYQRMEGVVATCVGYTQGRVERPSYGEVCSGRTGHTEACQLVYDPSRVTYLALCEKLFSTIDPTLRDRVGNDFGTQYRHGIYAHSDEQLEVAKAFVAAENERLRGKGKMVVTEVMRAAVFWPAEEYHQQYLVKGGRFGTGQSASKGCRDPVRCYG